MLLPVLTWMLARLPAQRPWILASALLLVLPTPFHWIDVHGLAPEMDPEPFWSTAQRLWLHSWKALPALAILVVSYRGLGEAAPALEPPR
jgi:hypothetical protein